MLPLAVFVSGGGTNLQALLDRFGTRPAGGTRPYVALVVSDREEAGALRRAERAGAATHVIAVRGREDGDVARETMALLDSYGVHLIALAGYLRRVPRAVVERYAGRIVNMHPALLPAFGGHGMYGVNVHAAVLRAGCRVSGATVHFVEEEYDRGEIVAQWPVPVLPEDTPETLAARVLRVEHMLYPLAIEAVARWAVGGSVGAVIGEHSFALESTDAPSEQDVRRALGLD